MTDTVFDADHQPIRFRLGESWIDAKKVIEPGEVCSFEVRSQIPFEPRLLMGGQKDANLHLVEAVIGGKTWKGDAPFEKLPALPAMKIAEPCSFTFRNDGKEAFIPNPFLVGKSDNLDTVLMLGDPKTKFMEDFIPKNSNFSIVGIVPFEFETRRVLIIAPGGEDPMFRVLDMYMGKNSLSANAGTGMPVSAFDPARSPVTRFGKIPRGLKFSVHFSNRTEQDQPVEVYLEGWKVGENDPQG